MNWKEELLRNEGNYIEPSEKSLISSKRKMFQKL